MTSNGPAHCACAIPWDSLTAADAPHSILIDVAFIGTHALIYSSDAPATRAALRDIFGFANIDAGDGWLIFRLPPA